MPGVFTGELGHNPKEWLTGFLDVTGMGAAWRSHFGAHLQLQYVRFRPDEVNLYKTRKDRGMVGFFKKRSEESTPTEA